MTANDNETEIYSALQKVLASKTFSRAKRSRRLLQYLVEQKLAGREELLKGFTIAVELFDRDANFDADKNPLVRVQMGRLRQHLANYYQSEGGSDSLQITIPKGSYTPRFEQNRIAAPTDSSTKNRATIDQIPIDTITSVDNIALQKTVYHMTADHAGNSLVTRTNGYQSGTAVLQSNAKQLDISMPTDRQRSNAGSCVTAQSVAVAVVTPSNLIGDRHDSVTSRPSLGAEAHKKPSAHSASFTLARLSARVSASSSCCRTTTSLLVVLLMLIASHAYTHMTEANHRQLHQECDSN